MVLVVATVAIGVAIWLFPVDAPLVTLLVPLVVSSLMLGPRQLPWFVVFVLLVLALSCPRRRTSPIRIALTVVIIFGLGFVVLLSSFRRSRLGVAGIQGEQMFVDLRDRILRHGGIPALPEEWYVAAELRSAGGTPFAGDFIVASRVGERLEVAVVDVSGKGQGAGTRALLLSGAIGGLHQRPAARASSSRPPTPTSCARTGRRGSRPRSTSPSTSTTGHYELRSAGHPPAALRHAGSGRWEVIETEGPILGLIEGTTYAATSGEMRRGDALLLYTDGMVETPHPRHRLGHRQDARPGRAAAARRVRGRRRPGSSTPSAHATTTARCCSSTGAESRGWSPRRACGTMTSASASSTSPERADVAQW